MGIYYSGQAESHSESESCRVKRFLNSFHSPNSEFFEVKTGFQTGGVGFENGPPFSFPPPDSTGKVNPCVVLLKDPTVAILTHSERLCVRHTQNHVGASTPDDFADQF